MAWTEHDATGSYFVCFRIGKRRFKRSLKTENANEADDLAKKLEITLRDVERGRLIIPENCDLVTFLLSDGRLVERPSVPDTLSLKELFEEYFKAMPEGSLELSTIAGMKIHQTQLQRILTASFPIRTLRREDLQEYIRRRSSAKGQRGKLSAATIKKEIVTLRTVWNWGVEKWVEGRFPNKGLKYPKTTEKPPFISFGEVEELTRERADDSLWESVYLTIDEMEELLKHVKESKRPFVYEPPD